MVICPRCQRSVNETIGTSCPICYARIVPGAVAAPSPQEDEGMPGSQSAIQPIVPHHYAPLDASQPFTLQLLNEQRPPQTQFSQD